MPHLWNSVVWIFLLFISPHDWPTSSKPCWKFFWLLKLPKLFNFLSRFERVCSCFIIIWFSLISMQRYDRLDKIGEGLIFQNCFRKKISYTTMYNAQTQMISNGLMFSMWLQLEFWKKNQLFELRILKEPMGLFTRPATLSTRKWLLWSESGWTMTMRLAREKFFLATQWFFPSIFLANLFCFFLLAYLG